MRIWWRTYVISPPAVTVICKRPATWLLKRLGVTGNQLSPSQTETLLGLLMQETGWLPRIHVLQMMDTLIVPSVAG